MMRDLEPAQCIQGGERCGEAAGPAGAPNKRSLITTLFSISPISPPHEKVHKIR
jgi:hypothetical protein